MTSRLLLHDKDARNIEHSLPFCLIGRDLYDCIPDIKYEGPIIAVEQITDAFGASDTFCWKLDSHDLTSIIDASPDRELIYVDVNGDLRSICVEEGVRASCSLFRVFKSDVGYSDQEWLIDLINSADEIDGNIMEELDRCTFSIGMDCIERRM